MVSYSRISSKYEKSLNHFSSNLFLQFLKWITLRFYEAWECWKCQKPFSQSNPPLKSFKENLEKPIWGYMMIHWERTILISVCTSKECFNRRPRREITSRVCPIEENSFRVKFGGKFRIPIYGPFSLKLRIPLASEKEVE